MTDEIVAIRALSRNFGSTVALGDVTLSVVRGTVFGLTRIGFGIAPFAPIPAAALAVAWNRHR